MVKSSCVNRATRFRILGLSDELPQICGAGDLPSDRVFVNQLKNVLQGRWLFVDRKSGKTRLETPAEGGQPPGRIAATFYQSESKAGPQAKAKSATAEAASSAQGTTMFGAFKTDPKAPIDVEADTLDVYDQTKQAIFRGNVRSKQGDFIVRAVEMAVFYTGQVGLGLASASSNAIA